MKKRLIKYNPLSHQKLFHESIKPKVFLSGGYGCLRGDQLIETIDGPVAIQDIKQPTLVRSLYKGRYTWMPTSASIPVLDQDIYQVDHDYGTLYCSETHQILSASAEYLRACDSSQQELDHSCAYSFSPLQKADVFFRSELLLCAPNLKQIAEDYLDRYLRYSSLYDRRLQALKDAVQEIAPLLNDARKSEHFFHPEVFELIDDCWILEPIRNHMQILNIPLSSLDFLGRLGFRQTIEAGYDATLDRSLDFDCNQRWRQFLLKSERHHKEAESFLEDYSYSTRIKQIVKVDRGTVYDLHVLGSNNYCSGGLVHSNSGKTHALVMKSLQLASVNRGLMGGLLAPDLKMMKRDIIPSLEDICDENGIKMEYNKMDSYIYLPAVDSKILLFHAQDEGRSIRGPNLAWGAINEVELIDYNSFAAFLARIRLKKAGLKQLIMSGTPESFGWPYSYFEENPREDTDVIYGRTTDNIFLAEDYVDMLRSSYDELMQQQYLDGRRVNLTGNRAAYMFDRRIHLDPAIEFDPGLPLYVSMDFNVGFMSCVFWNRYGVDSRFYLKAFDELCLKSSHTDGLCEAIKEKLPGHWQDAILWPDPAGAAGSTKSQGRSDIDILKQHGFRSENIKYKRSIISVRDCLNAVNNLFSKDKIRISPRCKNLISDLEQVTFKEGSSFELDKRDYQRTHWLDGMKNMIEFEFPIRRPTTSTRTEKYR